MIPDWLQPRLGEPLPPALVEWAASQPSLEAAVAACDRADWRTWLRANHATTLEEQRRVVYDALGAAFMTRLLTRRTTWNQLLHLRYTDEELAWIWAQPSVDDGGVGSMWWIYDVYNALLVVTLVLTPIACWSWNSGKWPTLGRFELVSEVSFFALAVVMHFGWRTLRRAVNRGRLRRYTFADAWKTVGPLVEPAWAGGSAFSRSMQMKS